MTMPYVLANGLGNWPDATKFMANYDYLESLMEGYQQLFRNRIINGDMRIDQRDVGAAVTINGTSATYNLDRWFGGGQATDGVFTLQQNSSAPDGFLTSLKATVTTADASIGAGQAYAIGQRIEGYNIADAGFGTAWAKTLTLSFWVRSSVTGLFGGSFCNADSTRCYPYTYTISVANTWEYKSITFAGDTTGTWLSMNTTGMLLYWSLGTGSTYLGTAGAWAGSNYLGATGQTNLISTNSATWYLTGVQLEISDTATVFEHRPIGTELTLCQRYYEKSYDIDVVPGAVTGNSAVYGIRANGGWACYTPYKVTKRAIPTIISYNPSDGASGKIRNMQSGASETASPTVIGTNGFQNSGTGASVSDFYGWHFTASAEL